MDSELLVSINRHEILKGFTPGGIGYHGTFAGSLNSIFKHGLKLPSQLGLKDIKDDVIAYYATPSQALILQTVNALGSSSASDLLLDATIRSLKNNVGYAQNEGFGENRVKLDWLRWQTQPDLLPAIVFFSKAGEVQPVGSPVVDSATGSFYSTISFPEMRSYQNIGRNRILSSVSLERDQVRFIDTGDPQELAKKVKNILVEKALQTLMKYIRG